MNKKAGRSDENRCEQSTIQGPPLCQGLEDEDGGKDSRGYGPEARNCDTVGGTRIRILVAVERAVDEERSLVVVLRVLADSDLGVVYGVDGRVSDDLAHVAVVLVVADVVTAAGVLVLAGADDGHGLVLVRTGVVVVVGVVVLVEVRVVPRREGPGCSQDERAGGETNAHGTEAASERTSGVDGAHGTARVSASGECGARTEE